MSFTPPIAPPSASPENRPPPSEAQELYGVEHSEITNHMGLRVPPFLNNGEVPRGREPLPHITDDRFIPENATYDVPIPENHAVANTPITYAPLPKGFEPRDTDPAKFYRGPVLEHLLPTKAEPAVLVDDTPRHLAPKAPRSFGAGLAAVREGRNRPKHVMGSDRTDQPTGSHIPNQAA